MGYLTESNLGFLVARLMRWVRSALAGRTHRFALKRSL